MRWLVSLQIFSIISSIAVGFWLPIRLVDFILPPFHDVLLDLAIMVVSSVNLYLHFQENKLSPRKLNNWFKLTPVLDVICLLPMSLIEFVIWGQCNPNYMLFDLIAIRYIWRVKAFLEQFDNLPPVAYRLIPLGFTMPMLVHMIACGWIALGSGNVGPDPEKFVEYVKAFYWAMTTLTTVGYGDISAKTPIQMIYASGVQITGVAVFGFVLSNVASLLSRLDAAREHHMDNLDKIETFMRSHNIPGMLRSKVRSYYHFLWTNHKGYQNRDLMQDLPIKMQSELLFHINSRIISKVPLFQGATNEFIEELMTKLEPVIYVPNEKIFRAGDDGEALYFIQNGHVDIQSKAGDHIASLNDGAFFGEMALISDQKRSATAVATTYCDVYRLPKDSFNRVLNHYPEFRHKIEAVVNARKTPKAS